MSPAERAQWIDRDDEVPLATQCELAAVPRSTVYRRLEAATRQPLGKPRTSAAATINGPPLGPEVRCYVNFST